MATKTIRKYTKTKPTLNHQLSRILKEHKSSPLKEILTLIPELNARDQVAAYFKIMDYLYAKPKAVDTGPKKKGPGIQTNVQINVPESHKESSKPDVKKLLAIAEGKDE